MFHIMQKLLRPMGKREHGPGPAKEVIRRTEGIFHYGAIVWDALPNTKLSNLQRLQIRAKKLKDNAKYKDVWNYNWLYVKSLTSFNQGVMTYRILHGLYPDNLRHKSVERSMISEHRTRNHRDLKFPKLG